MSQCGNMLSGPLIPALVDELNIFQMPNYLKVTVRLYYTSTLIGLGTRDGTNPFWSEYGLAVNRCVGIWRYFLAFQLFLDIFRYFWVLNIGCIVHTYVATNTTITNKYLHIPGYYVGI